MLLRVGFRRGQRRVDSRSLHSLRRIGPPPSVGQIDDEDGRGSFGSWSESVGTARKPGSLATGSKPPGETMLLGSAETRPAAGLPFRCEARHDRFQAWTLQVRVEAAKQKAGALELGHRSGAIGGGPDLCECQPVHVDMQPHPFSRRRRSNAFVDLSLRRVNRHGPTPARVPRRGSRHCARGTLRPRSGPSPAGPARSAVGVRRRPPERRGAACRLGRP
jgi:hypothetical protein